MESFQELPPVDQVVIYLDQRCCNTATKSNWCSQAYVHSSFFFFFFYFCPVFQKEDFHLNWGVFIHFHRALFKMHMRRKRKRLWVLTAATAVTDHDWSKTQRHKAWTFSVSISRGFHMHLVSDSGSDDLLPPNRMWMWRPWNSRSDPVWDLQTLTEFFTVLSTVKKEITLKGKNGLDMSPRPLLEAQRVREMCTPPPPPSYTHTNPPSPPSPSRITTHYEEESKYLSVCPLFPFLLYPLRPHTHHLSLWPV